MRQLPTAPRFIPQQSAATSNIAHQGSGGSVQRQQARPVASNGLPMGWLDPAKAPTQQERLAASAENGFKPFPTTPSGATMVSTDPSRLGSAAAALGVSAPRTGENFNVANQANAAGTYQTPSAERDAALLSSVTGRTVTPSTLAAAPAASGTGGARQMATGSPAPALNSYTAAPSQGAASNLSAYTARNQAMNGGAPAPAPTTTATSSPLSAYARPLNELMAADADPNRALNALMYSRAQQEAFRG